AGWLPYRPTHHLQEDMMSQIHHQSDLQANKSTLQILHSINSKVISVIVVFRLFSPIRIFPAFSPTINPRFVFINCPITSEFVRSFEHSSPRSIPGNDWV